MVFLAEFHGNSTLLDAAESKGQVTRWIGKDGHEWLGYATSAVVKESGKKSE